MSRARLLAAGVAMTGCGSASEDPGASPGERTGRVTRGTLAERVLLTGELRAGSSTHLSVPKTDAWQLTIRWLAKDGSLVKANERVLEFDNSTFASGLEQKRIAAVEAESSYRALREISALATAVKEHELQQHRIALEKALLLASVPPDLLPQRTAQDRQLEKLRAETAVAKAEKELVANKQASALEHQVKQLEVDKARRAVESAQTSIAELVMSAPRDGVVLVGKHPWEGRPFQVGDTVQPGMKVLSMPDLGEPMLVHAELSDVDDGRVVIGMAGTCTLDAYPAEPLACSVVELAPVAGTSNNESLRRAFAVGLTLARTDHDRMRPGMSVKIELGLAPPAPAGAEALPGVGALLVPRGAVVFGEVAKVRLRGGGLREVTLGACDAQRCAIERGLAEGDAVGLGGR